MNSPSSQVVTLYVTLNGAIALVPDGHGKFWALLPDARLPAPARWAKASDKAFYARAPHLSMLVANSDLIGGRTTPQSIASFISRPSTVGHASGERAVILLEDQKLEFVIPDGVVTPTSNIANYVPHMEKLSKNHGEVSSRFNPGLSTDLPGGLSSAFQLKGGCLDAIGFFGVPGSPSKLNFGYVKSVRGKLNYRKRIQMNKVANKLLWQVSLPEGQRNVVVNATVKSKPPRVYEFVAPEGRDEITINIFHSESEVPTLFLEDPLITDGFQPLPDPDFEMFYGLSNYDDERTPWRVPVPPKSGGSSAVEKPCNGGIFKGFSK